MERSSGAEPATRFGFSWADEVEREEREQQEEEEHVMQKGREAKRGEQAKADPFGAARPREVVLAEKGVDWRARDRELDAGRTRHVAAAAARTTRTAEAAWSRANSVAASARRAGPRDRDAARTHAAASTAPVMTCWRDTPRVVSHGRCGRGKRKKCAGEGPLGDQGRRRVFGELNVGEICGSSLGCSTNKSCDSARTKGIKASEVAVADGDGSRGSSAPAATMTAAASEDESAVGRKRRGRKRRRGRKGSKNTTEKSENSAALGTEQLL